jgi:hypothetical protein
VLERRAAATLAILIGAACAAACGGSTAVETVVGPDARCQTTLSGPSAPVPPAGATVNVSVTAARDCTWTAASEASWMQLNATSGQGNATLAVTVGRNDVPSARSGAIAVNAQRLTIAQEARPCSFELRASTQNLSSDGGTGTITVETLSGCSWTASSSAAWLRLQTTSGSGSGAIQFEASANSGGVRQSTITIGGESITITQDASRSSGGSTPSCVESLSPSTVNATVAGGTHSVTLTGSDTCDWRAASGASWLTVTPAAGRGTTTLTLTVTRNTGAARSTTVTAGTHSVAVNQAAMPACTVSIEPTSASFPASGGDGVIRVATPEGCDWSVTGGAEWIRVTTSRGSGGGEARYSVNPNNATSSRSATLTIGGRSHTVTQAADAPTCTYSVSATPQNFAGSGGGGSLTVTTQAGCAWTATAGAAWVTGGPWSGSGTQTVSFSVQANGGAARQTAIALNTGASVSITQDAAAPTCTYSVSASPQNFAAGGGGGSLTVTTQSGCAWTASAGAGWVTGGPWSGSGTQTVSFSVQANNAAARQTAITLNTGPSVSITQDAGAPTCTYSIAAAPQNFAAGGGGGSLTVTTQSGCAWTATAGAGWVTNGPWSGSGTQTVSFSVQANGGAARQTAITLNTGPSVSITQDAAAPTCTYSITATPQSFPSGGGGGSLTVTTQSGCAWTASAGAGWVTNGPWNGSGTQTVSFSVQANTGAARQTAITLNTGPSVTISQDAPVMQAHQGTRRKAQGATALNLF